MVKEVHRLEQLALQAHQAGLSWTNWWAAHGDAVRQAEPFSRERFQRLVSHLMHLCLTGDTSGEHPAGDDELSPFERDDQAAPSDTATRAKLLGDQGSIAAAIVKRCQARGADVRLGSNLRRQEGGSHFV